MNVVVFGASGATGRELLRQGAEHGHRITAFVRNPAALDAGYRSLQIVQGSVQVRSAVENAIVGQQAVICVLGSRTLLRRDPAIVVGVHNIITAMELCGIHRFVYLSSDSVHVSLKRSNPLRRLLLSVILHNPTADHELNERMIQESHLEWTIVRPPRLTNGQRTGRYQSGEHVKSSGFVPQISRTDLAEFMLKHLADNSFVRKAVELTNVLRIDDLRTIKGLSEGSGPLQLYSPTKVRCALQREPPRRNLLDGVSASTLLRLARLKADHR